MNIGTIQQSNYRTDYAGYAASDNAKVNEFYSGLSSAVEKTEGKGTGEVLGLTMLPYSNTMSYGMSAFYSEDSTPADPIIHINSNYGGENRSYDVHVNEVDPRNASQLEMFALSCYQDDQGITESGTFGSFSRMKAYAGNDADLGRGMDLQNPENAFAKFDWVSMLKRMAAEYLQNPQTYSQYLDCGKLSAVLEKWN